MFYTLLALLRQMGGSSLLDSGAWVVSIVLSRLGMADLI
jgi:hypothetical protein